MREELITQLEVFESQRRLLEVLQSLSARRQQIPPTPSLFIRRWATGPRLMWQKIKRTGCEIAHKAIVEICSGMYPTDKKPSLLEAASPE